MGKKRKLNRLITRWIKSDLPEDRSTVLLLGVTRIPTSPTSTRRPCSLPLGAIPVRDPVPFARRNSSSSRREATRNRNTSARGSTRKQNKPEASGSEKIPPPVKCDNPCYRKADGDSGGGCIDNGITECASDVTVTSTVSNSHAAVPGGAVMDRSVDSIGTCSLDMEASVEISDWSEGSSVGTLRSASLAAPSPEPRLPSYLSLACTVSGYSTTTNYDPIRLARSRDTSPHRPLSDNAQDNLTYAVHNNLLSPPNLVPLPIRKLNEAQSNTKNMTEHAITTHHRQEFYKSMTTVITTTSRNITSTLVSSDSIDSCDENSYRTKCLSYESRNSSNGHAKEYSNDSIESSKSFIQQRIERLYGPGALAQGFFVMKRQKNKSFEGERLGKAVLSNGRHSKSFNDQLLDEDVSDGNMKQSISSPALPVLRHLRPEFRAQLPIIIPKKESKSPMQKSITVPRIDETKVNGRSDNESVKAVVVNGSATVNGNICVNGDLKVCDTLKSDESKDLSLAVKDGHYFLVVLEAEAKRLLLLADAAEEELNNTPELPEEAKGYLRSASGKAKLLVSQKMQQFKGLCTKNITQIAGEAFPTTNEDLQGFWDMVMLQVDQVDTLFKQLDTLRANNWQEVTETDSVKLNGASMNGAIEKPRKVIKNRPVNAAAEQSRKQREALRKKLIEDKRKAMRELNKDTKQSIEIFVPESS